VGLPPLCYWDCTFEIRRENGCLYLASVVRYRGLCVRPISRGPKECGVSECDPETSNNEAEAH